MGNPTGDFKNTSGAAVGIQPAKHPDLAGALTLKTLKHSDRGDFSENGKLTGGGHGQSNMAELKRRKIKFEVQHKYENGVRTGRIIDHTKAQNKRDDGHAWFPEDWTDRTTAAAARYVSGLASARQAADGETIYGTYKGVRVGIKIRNGIIQTVFPKFEQKGKRRKV